MNHSVSRTILVCLFAMLLGVSSGCGKKGPPTQYIEGVVTLDGKPVEKALVSFIPTQPADLSNPDNLNVPLIASGNCDTDGKFLISAIQGGKIGAGTTEGEYRVMIVKKEITNAPVAQKNKPTPVMKGPPKFRYVVPKVFEDPNKSGIVVTVKKGVNKFDFALKSDGSVSTPFEK